jgi:hypothetical protein
MVAHKVSTRSPQSKHDFDTVDRLDKIPSREWQHLVPELLTWLQDANWPIFLPVRDLLLKCPRSVVEPLRRIFEGDDDAWQYYTLEFLVSRMPEDGLQALEPTLVAFRARITDEIDADWEMRKTVDEILGRADVQ